MKMEVVIPIRPKIKAKPTEFAKPTAASEDDSMVYRAFDPTEGRRVSMSRVIRPQPRKRRAPRSARDPSASHSSDPDYTPDQEIFVMKYKNLRPPKRPRESTPASSRSSVSLGAVQYESPQRRPKKRKEKVVDSSGSPDDETLVPKVKAEPSSGTLFEDLGYISESVDGSSSLSASPREDEYEASEDSMVDNEESEESEQEDVQFDSSTEHEDDECIETMMDLESDGRESEVPESLPSSPPPNPLPEKRATYPSVLRKPDSYTHAGSSTGPGTKEGQKRMMGYVVESSEQAPSERTQSTSSGKQVMFASEDEPHSSGIFRGRSRSFSVLSSRLVTPSSEHPKFSAHGATGGPQGRGETQTDRTGEWFAEIEADLTQTPQTPRRTLIAQAPPKSSELLFISRIGLGVVLEMLATKYGVSPEIAEQVYGIESGIPATEKTLKEMKEGIDGILFSRASSVFRESS
ncbi:hypothetical protein RhiJN_10572 [Ceratobasidium sp. AG-Ba]|nr:hypothetical protein RhiJN_10572 [Ceratobasidium sp. AG-Ba]QRW11309.1 hypothetical protein RhiLY_10308 [Ceratobasidium sp. AG-Ba]